MVIKILVNNISYQFIRNQFIILTNLETNLKIILIINNL